MINWFDMPAEGLSNGGLFEVKELDVTENGTYETKGEMYNKVTVNVEGGGGSSDFSTAEVTIVNNTTGEGMGFSAPFIAIESSTDTIMPSVMIANNSTRTYSMVLYKGVQEAYIHSLYDYGDITVSGDIEQRGDYLIISGDGTITISVGE